MCYLSKLCSREGPFALSLALTDRSNFSNIRHFLSSTLLSYNSDTRKIIITIIVIYHTCIYVLSIVMLTLGSLKRIIQSGCPISIRKDVHNFMIRRTKNSNLIGRHLGLLRTMLIWSYKSVPLTRINRPYTLT